MNWCNRNQTRLHFQVEVSEALLKHGATPHGIPHHPCFYMERHCVYLPSLFPTQANLWIQRGRSSKRSKPLTPQRQKFVNCLIATSNTCRHRWALSKSILSLTKRYTPLVLIWSWLGGLSLAIRLHADNNWMTITSDRYHHASMITCASLKLNVGSWVYPFALAIMKLPLHSLR